MNPYKALYRYRIQKKRAEVEYRSAMADLAIEEGNAAIKEATAAQLKREADKVSTEILVAEQSGGTTEG